MSPYMIQVPLDAVIIGAGFGGYYLLHHLRKQGFTARVFEESDGLGGVWRNNRYPGARVDNPTPFYEYSDPELWNKWGWTEAYSSQQEILKYFEFVDSKWNLSKDISFNTKVTASSFDPDRNLWMTQTNQGHVVASRFLLPAIGFASKPYTPRLDSLESFKGFACHTARWPAQQVDLQGKRIGVIGTGATGVQVIQELGPIAGSLTVFQRSPNCALPMRQRAGTPQNSDKKSYPYLFQQMRFTHAGLKHIPVARCTNGNLYTSSCGSKEVSRPAWGTIRSFIPTCRQTTASITSGANRCARGFKRRTQR